MNQSQNYILKNDHPSKNEYPPSNNANQNMELYKLKQLLQPNNYSQPIVGHSNINLNQEQSNYNDYPYITGKNNYANKSFNNINNQNYIHNIDIYSSPQSLGEKNKFINNNIIDNNLDSYNNKDQNKTLNLSLENNINNNINDKTNKDKKIEEVVEDPDEYMFREQNDNDKEDLKKGDESELSADSDKNSDNEQEFNDQLLAQYDKVKRVKNKWKVILKGCVVQQDNKEYICGKVQGELERDW
jgi:hypothetical protein